MPSRFVLASRWSPALALFLLLLSALWVAGGASHADVTGQVVTRGAAWSLLILAILLSARPVIAGADAAFWLLLATVLLVLLQLVPLPPAIWTALPGRDENGRRHVRTPVPNAHHVCRLLLETKK